MFPLALKSLWTHNQKRPLSGAWSFVSLSGAMAFDSLWVKTPNTPVKTPKTFGKDYNNGTNLATSPLPSSSPSEWLLELNEPIPVVIENGGEALAPCEQCQLAELAESSKDCCVLKEPPWVLSDWMVFMMIFGGLLHLKNIFDAMWFLLVQYIGCSKCFRLRVSMAFTIRDAARVMVPFCVRKVRSSCFFRFLLGFLEFAFGCVEVKWLVSTLMHLHVYTIRSTPKFCSTTNCQVQWFIPKGTSKFSWTTSQCVSRGVIWLGRYWTPKQRA